MSLNLFIPTVYVSFDCQFRFMMFIKFCMKIEYLEYDTQNYRQCIIKGLQKSYPMSSAVILLLYDLP